MAELPDLVDRRAAVLEALDDRPRSKPELVDATPASRSTIDRAVDELLEAGLVRRAGSEFSLTPTGTRILDAYREFHESARLYHDYREFVDGIAVAEDLPPAVLDGADVTFPTPEMPTRPIKRVHEELLEADRVYSTCPVLMAFQAEFWASQLPDLPVELEVVYSQGALDAAFEEYPDRYRTLLDSGDLTAYVADELPASYSFAVAEGLASADGGSRLVVGSHGDRNALLRNDDAGAVGWGRETFRRLVDGAEPVECRASPPDSN